MQADVQNMIDMINKVNAQALVAAKEVAAINTRAFDKLVQQQLGLVTETVQAGVKQIDLLREVKGYKEYLAAQAELAQQGAEKALTAARETVAVLNGVRDELSAVVEKGVEAIGDAKPTAKKAA